MIGGRLKKAYICSRYLRWINPSFSQEGEDLLLERVFSADRKKGFYVDVGAHHPVRFSNTFHFYQRGWSGINIDPNPGVAELFKKMRPRDISLAMGISDESRRQNFYVFEERALSTFDHALASQRQKEGFVLSETREINCETLATILGRSLNQNSEGIDFFSIDCEGYDLKVLQSNDWLRFRPRIVCVEALQTALDSLLESPLHKFMLQVKYRLFAKIVNSTFYISDEFGKSMS